MPGFTGLTLPCDTLSSPTEHIAYKTAKRESAEKHTTGAFCIIPAFRSVHHKWLGIVRLTSGGC